MNNESLQIRFTDEKYASRFDVARMLGTNLIDQIWNNILAYRKQFEKHLPLNDISKAPLYITFGKKINDITGSVDGKAGRFNENFSKLNAGDVEHYTYTHESIRTSLSCIARVRNIQINDLAIGNIVNKKAIDVNYAHLVNYYKALLKLENAAPAPISIDLIAEYLSVVKGEEGLNSFYRMTEVGSASQKALINREYAGAPTGRIEEMMDEVVSFANSREYPVSLRAALAYYMVNYIKPFDEYNEELAIIIAKLILLNSGMSKSIAYLPIEKLAVQRSFEYGSMSKEVQKSKDATYVALLLLEICEETLSQAIDRLVTISVKTAGEVYLKGEDNEQIKEEFGEQATQETTPSEPVVEKVDLGKRPPLVKQPKPAVREDPIVVSRPTFVGTEEKSEKELRRLEQDMLESDPTLRPAQARFYVRHCTPGKYYTIEQYKKETRCVYETARTSMDTLAKKGYYQREKVNNKKFVYTPINK